MKTYSFFGYGALSNRHIVKEIIGRDPGVGKNAIVEGYQLAYQVFDQLPKNVRSIIEKVWGIGFRAYTMRSGPGVVAGTIWELTEKEMIRIREWNFVGTWREIQEIKARTSTGETVPVIVEKVSDSQPIKEVVDGIRYDANLNPEGHRIVEEQFREAELERVRLQLSELHAIYTKGAFA